MMNGRLAENGFFTCFSEEGDKRYIHNQDEKIDAAGLQSFTSRMKQGVFHGQTKFWLPNANIFIGDTD